MIKTSKSSNAARQLCPYYKTIKGSISYYVSRYIGLETIGMTIPSVYYPIGKNDTARILNNLSNKNKRIFIENKSDSFVVHASSFELIENFCDLYNNKDCLAKTFAYRTFNNCIVKPPKTWLWILVDSTQTPQIDTVHGNIIATFDTNQYIIYFENCDEALMYKLKFNV